MRGIWHSIYTWHKDRSLLDSIESTYENQGMSNQHCHPIIKYAQLLLLDDTVLIDAVKHNLVQKVYVHCSCVVYQ